MSAAEMRENTSSHEGPPGAESPSAGWRFVPAGVPTWEAVALALMMLAVGLAHGWNMFHFPYYEADEGTYMAQAQALVEHGRLAPYTYWYDHAPGGWMLIGLWTKLTGGFTTFGFSINSGRVLMLFLHLGSSLLLYLIVRRITGRPGAALLAIAVFSFGGGGIYYQRRVLLDNIAVFWLFGSVAALVLARGRLSRFVLSGGLLGIALLSKETIAFLAPVLFAAAVVVQRRGRRVLAGVLFAGTASVLLACYALYATLKGELFPSGTRFGGSSPHVSLLETLLWQGSRPGGRITQADSLIRAALTEWTANDPVWMPLAVAITVAVSVLAITNPKARLPAALLVGYWLFLLRGGIVLPFYVGPLYALVGLAAGTFVGLVLPTSWPRYNPLRRLALGTTAAGMCVVVAGMFVASVGNQRGQGLFSSDQTSAQTRAVDWLMSRDDARTVAIDDYAYIELHGADVPPHLEAEYYWKLDRDPQVRRESTNNDSGNIDYLAVTPQMDADLRGLPFTRAALDSSRPLVAFQGDGWGVEVWVNMVPHRILNSSWHSYLTRYVSSGRATDPQEGGATIAYEQAAAMLRAVQSDDRAAFDSLWNWAVENLEHKGLWLSQWKEAPSNSGDANASDPASTVDAALALALAGRRWDEPAYTRAAGELADSVWSRAVVHTGLGPVVTSDALVPSRSGYAAVAPTTINPAAYRELARIDSAHDWKAVLDASYRVVGACSTQGYPARLCGIGLASGVGHALTLPSEMSNDLRTAELGSRLAMDHQWSGDVRDVVAARHLQSLVADWKRRGRLAAEYGPSGNRVQDFESATAYGGYMGAVALLEPSQLKAVYERGLKSQFFDDGSLSYWQDPKNGAAQNAGWLGTAVYAGSLSDFR